ncbi:hypothetical protein BZM27_05860 [Paraburkholderia steynii]|uniref:Uncharacterized protein n=1 Tax=Paraburkholderia steynii TaxID=1245441 RepID=A0A4R0XKC1_9BURK|nr:hypothetical protein BZM27_05860 [Paraburkholderia steynii]
MRIKSATLHAFRRRIVLLTAAGGRSGAFTPTPALVGVRPDKTEGKVKRMLKKILIWLYCRGVLSMTTVARMFERFDLRGL